MPPASDPRMTRPPDAAALAARLREQRDARARSSTMVALTPLVPPLPPPPEAAPAAAPAAASPGPSPSALGPPAVLVTPRAVSDSSALVPAAQEQHAETLLSAPVANLVTTLATSARLSLRVTAFFIEAILETSQYSTRVSLGYTRRLLITAISSARRVYLASNAAMDRDILRAIGLGGEGDADKYLTSTSTDAFLNVLDRWTNLGIYVIHHTFTMAELFAMSGFYLTASTVNSATVAAHESVTLFDSLFGSNETSRALASIITLVRKEILEDERFKAAERGKVACLTALTRALTAFAVLQNATWSRTSRRLNMSVLYDCTVVTSSDDTFSTKLAAQALPIEDAIPAAGPGPNTIAGRQHRHIPSISTTDADGDVQMGPPLAITAAPDPSASSTDTFCPAVPPRPPHPSRANSCTHVPTHPSPDLELLWRLEELVGESGDAQLDAAEATPDGHRQRLLKRVRDDMYEITDELSESTIVTQTLERVATGGTYRDRDRDRQRRLSTAAADVVVEPMDDNGPSSIAPATAATAATSVCDPDEENDWIEVDHILDDDEADPMYAASTSPQAQSPQPQDSTERIQVVLHTMTNKLLQRKRTVRRVHGVGLGVQIAKTSQSPPPERTRSSSSRSSTPVADRDRLAIESGPGNAASSSAAAASSRANSIRNPTPPSSGRSTPLSKGKGKRPPPLSDGTRRTSSIVNAAGNVIRSLRSSSNLRSASGKATPVQGESFPRSPDSPVDVPRPPPPTPYLATASLPPSTPSRQLSPPSTPYSPPSASIPYSSPSRRGGSRTLSISESVRTRSNRIHASSSQIFCPTTEAADSLFPHEGLIKNIHRFCRYSSAAYGQNFLRILGLGNSDIHFSNTGRHHANSWAFAQHTRIPIESLLLSSYTENSPTIGSDKAPPLVHYIAVEHHLKAVVLTCRGTLGLSDVLVDLTCDYSHITVDGGDPNGSYFVHSGMYTSALKLTEKCSRVHQTLVDALLKYPDYGLVLCGHSLGGGVAALLAIMSATKADVFRAQNAARSNPVRHPPISTPFVTSFDSGLPPGRPIHCYAYGIPAVASIDLAKYASGLISSIVQNADVVPTLSLGLLRDLKNIAVTLYEEAGVAEEIVGRAVGLFRKKFAFQTGLAAEEPHSGVSDDQMLADWMMSLIKTMRADMDNDKLYPPGVVYIMEYFDVALTADAVRVGNGAAVSNPHAQRVILRQCNSVEERFREPLFSKTMLNDHLPSHYERSTHLLYEGLGQGLL